MIAEKRKIYQRIAVLLANIYVLCCAAWLMRQLYGKYWNNSMIVFVFLFVVNLFIADKAYKIFQMHHQRRILYFSAINAFVLALVTIWGALIKNRGYVFENLTDLLVAFFVVGGLFLPYMALNVIALFFLSEISKMPGVVGWKFSVKTFLLTASVIFGAWIPVLAAYYPGVFAYDVTRQLEQVIEKRYSTFHPLIHTWTLGLCFKMGGILGNNYTLGILLYSLLQMAVMALCFSYAVMYLSKSGNRKIVLVLSTAFFALFLVHYIMAVSTVKDSMFSALVLVFVVENFKLAENVQLFENKKWLLRFIVIGTVMLLFRNNALYAFLFCIPFWIWGFRRHRKKAAKVIISLLAFFFLVYNAMVLLFHAEKGSMLEMLSIPLQQIARTAIYDGGNMDTELRDEIRYFIPDEALENYSEAISDGIKSSIEEEKIKGEPLRFLKLYLKLFLKFPEKYLDAFLIMTLGEWYLNDTSHANIYGSGRDSRLGYLLTNHKQMPSGYEVADECYFPALRDIYEFLFSANYYQKLPVISIVFAPAFYWWVTYFFFMTNLYWKKYNQLFAVIFMVGYYGTVLLGPACLIRYMYPFVTCMPVFVCKLLEE